MLIPMALFGNIGGTSTMIGDPPNLIIGNAFKEELGFVDFLKVLAPGVCLTLPPRWRFCGGTTGRRCTGKRSTWTCPSSGRGTRSATTRCWRGAA